MISTYQTPLQKAKGFDGLPIVEQVRRAKYLVQMTSLIEAAASKIPEKMRHANPS